MRVHVAVCAVVLSVLAVPAARAEEGTLVIRAARSGWVDVEVATPFMVDRVRPVVATEGTYAGFWMEAVDRGGLPATLPWESNDLGYLQVEMAQRYTVDFRGRSMYVHVDDDYHGVRTDFPAGRWRVHVATDAPVEFRVPLPGITGTVVATVKHPSRSRLATRAWSVPAGAQGESRVPFEIRGRSLAITGYGGYTTTLGSPGTECFWSVAEGRCTDKPDDTGGMGSSDHAWTRDGIAAAPGTLPPGGYEGYHRMTAVGPWGPATTFALVLEAPAP